MEFLFIVITLIAFCVIWFCVFVMGYVFCINSTAEQERKIKQFEDGLFCLVKRGRSDDDD